MTEKSTPSRPDRTTAAVPIGFDISPFRVLHDEMDRLLSSFSLPQIGWSGDVGLGNGSLGLRVDIAETDTEIEVKADMPGIEEKDVEVTLEGDTLRLHAEKFREDDRKEQNWRVRERAFGSFDRSIRVPHGISPDAVDAKFKKGVLTLTLPKPKGAETKRIAIKS